MSRTDKSTPNVYMPKRIAFKALRRAERQQMKRYIRLEHWEDVPAPRVRLDSLCGWGCCF